MHVHNVFAQVYSSSPPQISSLSPLLLLLLIFVFCHLHFNPQSYMHGCKAIYWIIGDLSETLTLKNTASPFPYSSLLGVERPADLFPLC